MLNCSNELFSQVRFGPETRLLADLLARYGLEDLIRHLVDSDQVAPLHQLVMAQQLRLTPLLAPRLFGILEELCQRLSFDEPVHLYVMPGPQINAGALARLQDDDAHIISMTSAMVTSMTDDELRFALGHELGHLGLRHAGVMIAYQLLARSEDESENGSSKHKSRPQMLERRLDKWNRLAEFSADRIGLLACAGRLDVAVSAFFKMASGLGPEHLRFDLSAFLEQLEEIQHLDRKEVLARFSHPATPVRARALQLFSEAGASAAAAGAMAAVDEQVDAMASLMDFEVSSDLGVQAREFLVSAGLLAAHADGEISEAEQDALIHLLLQVTGDPESHLSRIEDTEQARTMLRSACAWLRENTGQERFGLFGQLAHIVAIDGLVTDAERAFMMEVALLLDVPEKSAREILHDVLSRYVQTKAGMAARMFGLRG
ncbi:MAG: M48 family metallopeptidase [Phycisphaerales bacterium JB039]